MSLDDRRGVEGLNILCIGDVCGKQGCEFLRRQLPVLKRKYAVDFTIVNGENSYEDSGITALSADHIFKSGADVITGGNHSLKWQNTYNYYDSEQRIVRPYNLYGEVPGRGFAEYDLGSTSIAVINLMGSVYMSAAKTSVKNPFYQIDEILEQVSAPIKIVDFHAEATSEKKAMGHYLAGRVSAVFGTHTHVLTDDAVILKNHTGYITDIGMTGVRHSVIGIDVSVSIENYKTNLYTKLKGAVGDCALTGVVFEIDSASGTTVSMQTIKHSEQ
jgi:hypothetical protein